MNTFYSYGYKDRPLNGFVEALKEREVKVVIDTRYNPHCFDPFWKFKNLQNEFPLHGMKYHHIKNLGNRTYFQEGEINIDNMEWGINRLRDRVGNHNFCLLCVCSNIQTCHTRLIVEELIEDDEFNYMGRIK